MKAILRLSDCGETTIIGLTDKDDIVEQLIVDDFKGYGFGEGELVKIEYEGRSIYATRQPVAVDTDGFEYVDNDGNPINEDGSEKIEANIVDDTPLYEYDEDIWVVREVKLDTLVDLSGSDFFIPETDTIFGAHENIVVFPV